MPLSSIPQLPRSSGGLGLTRFQRGEKKPHRLELAFGRVDPHDGLTEDLRVRALPAIPADVLARDPDPRLYAVEDVQIAQVSRDNITRFGRSWLRGSLPAVECRFDFAEYPRPSLGRAPDHDRVCARRAQHLRGLRRRVDVAVGDDRNSHRLLDLADRVVLERVLP